MPIRLELVSENGRGRAGVVLVIRSTISSSAFLNERRVSSGVHLGSGWGPGQRQARVNIPRTPERVCLLQGDASPRSICLPAQEC